MLTHTFVYLFILNSGKAGHDVSCPYNANIGFSIACFKKYGKMRTNLDFIPYFHSSKSPLVKKLLGDDKTVARMIVLLYNVSCFARLVSSVFPGSMVAALLWRSLILATFFYVGRLLGELSGPLFPMTEAEQRVYLPQRQRLEQARR